MTFEFQEPLKKKKGGIKEMKKKLLSTLLCVSMVATMAAGCGSSSDSSSDSSSSDTNTDTSASTEATSNTDTSSDTASETVDYGSGTITVWVAEAAVELTQTACDAFMADNGLDYTVTVEACGEGDAASNVITDVEGAADIFGFAQDQLTRLVAAGGLQPLSGDYISWAEENNDDGAVSAATSGDYVYAFPMTSDNGYFLYYDSSVISDPSTLEGIIADCEAAGKNFYYAFTSWYEESFFFATGCTLEYETDSDGNFTAANIDIANDGGLVALNEMIELASSSSFQSGSSAPDAVNVAAIVDGTWDSSTIQELFGDNYACAKLPTFTGTDGATYQLSGFGGYKLLGIKPQTDAGKLAVCYMLAQYLTDYDMQMTRFNELGWGPSNLEAQASDEVQADPALAALAEQLAYCIPQGQYSTNYWTIMDTFGADVVNGTVGDDLEGYLQTLQDDLIADIQ